MRNALFASKTKGQMKRHIVIYMVVLMTAGCCVLPTCAVQGDNDFQRAIHQGAMARISVRVVDDERKPVCDVKVEAHFDAALQSAGEVKISLTDTNGIAVVSGKTGKAVSIRASKSGYYSSSDSVCFVSMGQGVKDGRWLPFDLERMIVLRRIRNPVADMPRVSGPRYTKNMGMWMGFDLAKYDFVAPNGNGHCADMEVKFDWDGQRGVNFNGMEVCVRFVEPYSGACYQDRVMMSDFKEAYFALTNGMYRHQWNVSQGV